MADTVATDLSFPVAATDKLAEIIWATDAHVQTQRENFFNLAGMMAKDRGKEEVFKRRPGVPIIIKDEFKKMPGDRIRIRMRKQLTRVQSNSGSATSAYTYGATNMMGNEEALVFHDLEVKLGLLKNAVGFNSPDWYLHRVSIDMEQDAQDALREWLVENHEESIVDSFYEKFPYFIQSSLSATAVTHPKVYYANGRAAANDMSATDILSESEIRRIRTYCVHKRLNPIRADGKNVFLVLSDPFVLADLMGDANFRAVVSQAQDRGSENPLVKGAQFGHLGLFFWEYDRVRLTSSGANSGQISQLMVLGADAIAVGYGSEPRLVPRIETAYGDRWGLAIRQIFGAVRCDWLNQAETSTIQQSSAQWNVWEQGNEFSG